MQTLIHSLIVNQLRNKPTMVMEVVLEQEEQEEQEAQEEQDEWERE